MNRTSPPAPSALAAAIHRAGEPRHGTAKRPQGGQQHGQLLKPQRKPQQLEQLTQAIALLRQEDLDQAQEALQNYCQQWPQDADGLHYLGLLRHTQGRTQEALALLQQSLQIAPQNAGHWSNYGNVLFKQLKLPQAQEAYETSLKLAGHAPGQAQARAQALSNLCSLKRKQGLWQEAEALARQAIAAQPEWGDAWYNLSIALMEQGRVPEGLQANSRAITLWPRHLQGRERVLRALILLGEREEAAKQYQQWLQEEPNNPIVQHQYAACVAGTEGQATPERASDAYVEQVFDSFAASFDAKLALLGYCAPQLIAQALAEHLGPAPSEPKLSVVDLGCGTGLAGPLLKPWARRLAGCDLSVGMLRQAQLRAVYEVLHKAELVHYLRTQPSAFDVIVSADTLCYFGALEEAMHACVVAMREGAVLAFTVEALPEGDERPHALLPQGRYAHSRPYVQQALQGAGLKALRLEAVQLRMEAGQPVNGWLVLAHLPLMAMP